MCGDAFVNAGTGWAYSDNGTYVNSTIASYDQKIRSIEVYHIISNLYIRFWCIFPYDYYYANQSYYFTWSDVDTSNQSARGTSSYKMTFNKNNLLTSTGSSSDYFRFPLNLWFAAANHTMNSDFGYDLHSITRSLPLDTCYNTAPTNVQSGHQFSIASGSSASSMYAGGYSKTFWTVTDDLGNYIILGFGHTNLPRKYDRIHCFGNLINNLDSSDNNKFFALYDSYTDGTPYTTLGKSGPLPPSTVGLSFYAKRLIACSKDGIPYNNEQTNNTSFTTFAIDPQQFKFGNQINYTPLRVYLQSNDTNDTLVSNGQSNKGFVSTDYIRYIGTDYPGTSANLWRTFDNKNWMLLTPGYLFRWDPTAPDMRNF